MRLNVFNEYTYTLETIVQAGREKIAMTSVPIHTNEELRPSRLFHSMFGYVKRSSITIIRAFMMYKPLRFFTILGTIPLAIGIIIGIRYLFFLGMGVSGGHVQSLILASILILMGFMTIIIGLQADIIAANRKILQDVQYRVRKMEYDIESNKKGVHNKEV